jgi:hypothetical protein
MTHTRRRGGAKSSDGSSSETVGATKSRVLPVSFALCVCCGERFTPAKPTRGPASKRCFACYPETERRRNLERVRASVRRAAGEHVPSRRTCKNCAAVFEGPRSRHFCSRECLIEYGRAKLSAAVGAQQIESGGAATVSPGDAQDFHAPEARP